MLQSILVESSFAPQSRPTTLAAIGDSPGMEALVLNQPEGVTALEKRDVSIPTPSAGEIRIDVRAVGLNPVDYKLARDGHSDWEYPHILGLDVAGIVDSVGDGIYQWREGDAVYYHADLSQRGGFAEYAVTDAHVVAPMPENRSFVEAAAVPCAGLTAYQAIDRRLDVESGKSILVHGGSGGVGGFAVQFARLAGLTVYTTCSPENETYVHRLGADVAIDYHAESIPDRIDNLTGGLGVDYIVDIVGGDTVNEAVGCLAFGGELACVSELPDPEIREAADGVSVHDIFLGGAHLVGDRHAQEDLARMGREVGTLLTDRNLDPTVSETVELGDVLDALSRLENGEIQHGKVVARIGTSSTHD